MRTLRMIVLVGLLLPLLYAQEQQPAANNTNPSNANPNNPSYVLKVQSDLVLTNVVVRDKHTGAVVKGVISPPRIAISLTKRDEIAWWRGSAIRKTVSISVLRR